jgi:TetR/AcrR family transcriptional regulator, fatty acid metabolism regulator protein
MAKESHDPIQEQLIAARRSQILDAATRVFAEKGFHSATIRDVAKAAGIADGTIYNYFENKTGLMLGILNRLNESERRDDDLAQMNAMDLRAFFQTYMAQRYAVITQEGLNVFRAILPEVLVNPELQEQYLQQIIEPTFVLAEKHFGQMIEDGKITPLNVPLALRVMSATFLGLLVLRMIGDGVVESQWDELPGLLATMTLDGLIPR